MSRALWRLRELNARARRFNPVLQRWRRAYAQIVTRPDFRKRLSARRARHRAFAGSLRRGVRSRLPGLARAGRNRQRAWRRLGWLATARRRNYPLHLTRRVWDFAGLG